MAGRSTIQGRKQEHVRICLGGKVSHRHRFWDDVVLVHDALPELDLRDVDLQARLFGKRLQAPIMVAAMTGGYPDARRINRNLAEAAERAGVGLGVGSQRAALEDPSLRDTFSVVKDFDIPLVLGNVGAPQLIAQGRRGALTLEELEEALEMVGGDALAVHLNFLQEVAQWDGDAQSRGCLAAIDRVSRKMRVVVKETGAGISREVARRILRTRAIGIDIGGAGGTSFSAVEAHRARRRGERASERLGTTFWNWGIPAPVSVLEVRAVHPTFPIMATGGVRSGLDVARAIALGASAAGMASHILGPASRSAEAAFEELELVKRELRAAMLLTGSRDVRALSRARRVLTGPTGEWASVLD